MTERRRGLQQWAVVAEQGMKMGNVARAMQAYPSLGAGNQQLAWDARLDGLIDGRPAASCVG